MEESHAATMTHAQRRTRSRDTTYASHMPSTWSDDDLRTIGDEDEVVLASRRADGSLGSPATIWIVRVGDEVFVRSAFGPGNRWYARALRAGAGHVSIGDVSRDAVFEDASLGSARPADAVEVDDAFHAKYDGSHPKQDVDPVVDAVSHTATLRVMPA
jgi:hypothetical protein